MPFVLFFAINFGLAFILGLSEFPIGAALVLALGGTLVNVLTGWRSIGERIVTSLWLGAMFSVPPALVCYEIGRIAAHFLR